jgi:LCP family protein required for cell wall assembly
VGDLGSGTSTDDDEKVSTPVGDQPTRGGAGDRDVPGRSRRARADQPDAAPVTVEQLLARSGGAVGRRAARRTGEFPRITDDEPRAPKSEEPAPAVRSGLPPVPGAAPRPGGLPPVPGSAPPQVARQPGLPPVPAAARPAPADRAGAPAAWQPDSRPSRRSGPIPPLPGRVAPAEPGAAGRPRKRLPNRAADRPPASPGRRRTGRAVAVLAAVVGVVVLYHLGLYFYVDQKIERVEALATDGPEVLAPQLQAGSETYLVVGTGIPGQDGAASVATLLASVSPEGDRAVLISVPPTALVDTPMCRTPDGTLRSPTTEAFAAALLDGGPSCLVRAVQQLSGLRVDHYLGVDLTRLPGMVDALGGVPVCVVPTAATAAAAEPLPAGSSEVSGEAASGFLRPGDTGSDVTGAAVAERAQRLLTSTLRSAMSISTLADPVTLTRFLSRAADALTVDEATTLGDLRVLAGSLGDLSGDAVQRSALPVEQVGYVPAGSDQAYVVLDGGATRTLFDAVIGETQVPEDLRTGEAPAPTDAAAPAAPAPEAPAAAPEPAPGGLTVPPGQITVDVLNGTGTTGLAATVADLLRAQGYGVAAVGNEPGTVNETVVRHGPGVLEAARTVAAAVPGSVLQASDSIGDTVQLVIGPGYETVVPVEIGPAPEAGSGAAADTPAAAEPTPAAPAPVSC